jgi:ribonucleoside-triphosphate reductase (formate)
MERQPCEIYSRVNGYLRPVKQFNDAKQAEFYYRINYKLNEND